MCYAMSIIIRAREYPVDHVLTNYYLHCRAEPSITTSARGERLQPRPGHSGSRLAQAVLSLVPSMQNYFSAILFSQWSVVPGLTLQRLIGFLHWGALGSKVHSVHSTL